jgi:hypothetical protein
VCERLTRRKKGARRRKETTEAEKGELEKECAKRGLFEGRHRDSKHHQMCEHPCPAVSAGVCPAHCFAAHRIPWGSSADTTTTQPVVGEGASRRRSCRSTAPLLQHRSPRRRPCFLRSQQQGAAGPTRWTVGSRASHRLTQRGCTQSGPRRTAASSPPACLRPSRLPVRARLRASLGPYLALALAVPLLACGARKSKEKSNTAQICSIPLSLPFVPVFTSCSVRCCLSSWGARGHNAKTQRGKDRRDDGRNRQRPLGKNTQGQRTQTGNERTKKQKSERERGTSGSISTQQTAAAACAKAHCD